jgi:hypothetical protein
MLRQRITRRWECKGFCSALVCQGLGSRARRMTPIAQALTGLGGYAAFIGFIGTVFRWLRPHKAT